MENAKSDVVKIDSSFKFDIERGYYETENAWAKVRVKLDERSGDYYVDVLVGSRGKDEAHMHMGINGDQSIRFFEPRGRLNSLARRVEDSKRGLLEDKTINYKLLPGANTLTIRLIVDEPTRTIRVLFREAKLESQPVTSTIPYLSIRDLDFEIERECWNRYKLEDDSILKTKVSLMRCFTMEGGPQDQYHGIHQILSVVKPLEGYCHFGKPHKMPSSPTEIANTSAESIDFQVDGQQYNIYKLADGTRLKMETTLVSVKRYTEFRDEFGIPSRLISSRPSIYRPASRRGIDFHFFL